MSRPGFGRASLGGVAVLSLGVLLSLLARPALASLTINGRIVEEDVFLDASDSWSGDSFAHALDDRAILFNPFAKKSKLWKYMGSFLTIALLTAAVLARRHQAPPPPVDPVRRAQEHFVEASRRGGASCHACTAWC